MLAAVTCCVPPKQDLAVNDLSTNIDRRPGAQAGAWKIIAFVIAEFILLVFFASSVLSVQSELSRIEESRRAIANVEKTFNLSVRRFLAMETNSDQVKTVPRNGQAPEPLIQASNTRSNITALLGSASMDLLANINNLSLNGNSESRAREGAILQQMNRLESLLKASIAQVNYRQSSLSTYFDQLIESYCLLSAFMAVVLTFISFRVEKLLLARISSLIHRAQLLSEGRQLTLPSEGSDAFAIIDKQLYKTSQLWNDSRRKARIILDNAADVICIIDQNLCFVELSRSSKKAWGFAANELAGAPLSMLICPESIQHSRETFSAAVENQQLTEAELVLKSKDGVLKTFMWTINFSSSSTQFYCTAHDISDLKLAQQFRQDLLNMVSHDMRAPLSSAKISLSLLESGNYGNLPESVRTALKQTDAEIERINDLVETMLELQRLERVQQINVQSCVSVFELCSTAIKEYQRKFPYSCLEIETPQGDGAVSGSEERLSRAFFHLLCVIAGSSKDARHLSIQIKTEEKRVQCIYRTDPPIRARTEEFEPSEIDRIRLKIAAILLKGREKQLCWSDSGLTISMPEFTDDAEASE